MKHTFPAAILLEALYAALAFSPDFRNRLPLFLALFVSAILAALVFWRSAARGGSRRAILAWALLFRATLLCRAPDLSDDLYRYVWDGRVAAAGISPYDATPDDPSLAFLRDRDWERMGHRDARTIYPPAAEALFRVAAGSPRPAAVLKVVFAGFDLAVVWLLLAFPGGESAAALYAAFPLPVFESAGMGHLDSAGIALALAAAVWLARGRRAGAGAALAASALLKYIPGFAFLAFLRRGRLAFALAFAATAAALWWSAPRGNAGPATGLANFATRWEGNSVVYPVVERGMELTRLPDRAKRAYADWKSRRPQRPWMEKPWPFFYPAFFARALLGILLAAGLLHIAFRVPDLLAATAASLELLLLLSPVFHPWYALWVLPFAALSRRTSWIYLSGAVALAYALLYPVPGLPMPVILGLEYIPFAWIRARETPWEETRILPVREGSA